MRSAFTILLLLGFGTAVHADFGTGVAYPIKAPVTDCSVPSPDVPQVADYQVSSEFKYYSCKEYRQYQGTQLGNLYYVLEPKTDGEYIRLIARPGQPTISQSDYAQNADAAVKTCNLIREGTISHAQDLDKTPCAGQSFKDGQEK